MITLLHNENIKIISSNRRLIQARGRFISNPDYAAFKKELCLMIRPVKLDPHYHLEIYAECYADADNIIKPVIDSLELRGVIDNDRNVVRVDMHKVHIPKGKPGMIIVRGVGNYIDDYGRAIKDAC